MTAELAVVEGEAADLRRIVETATLWSSEGGHEEIFVRFEPGRVETPANGEGATQMSYCTLEADGFDRLSVEQPVDALFPTGVVLAWLDWLDGDSVTARFEGDPEHEAGLAEQLVLVGDRREVSVDCVTDPGALDPIEIVLPARFDGTQYLDEDGDPVPTRIETTAEELEGVVAAVDRCDGTAYPLSTEDGDLVARIDGSGTSARLRLDGTVSGPGVDGAFAPGFARVVRTIEGPVQLQTGFGLSLAFVQTGPEYTLRYVVERA